MSTPRTLLFFVVAAALAASLACQEFSLGSGNTATPATRVDTPTPTATMAPTATPTVEPGHPGFTIHFIDVGQGDATLVSTTDGRRLLIDGGRSQGRLRTRLEAIGVDELDAIVATHADADHISGLIEVLEMYDVERIYYHREEKDTATYEEFERLSAEEGAEILDPRRGDSIELGYLTFEVLHPGAELTGDSNEDSVVLSLSCGTVDVYLMGDAGERAEEALLREEITRDIEVLKVGHHGSETATSPEFLDAVAPEHAVISAGFENQFGHPHEEVLHALQAEDVEVILTDTNPGGDDTVVMDSDCEDYLFSTMSASLAP